MSDNGRHEPHDNLLDLYADGLLTGPDRLAFEQRLESDPELREALDLQNRMDASLRRSFVAPPAPDLPADTPGATPATWFQRVRRSRWLAVAAVLLIAIGAWRIYDFIRSNRQPNIAPNQYPDQRLVQLPMDKAYRVELQRGFKPQWVCRDEREFVTTFYHKLGVGLTIAQLPPNQQSLGLSFTPSVSADTVGMLGRVDGQPVMLFVDRLDRDSAQSLSDPSLRLFRRQLAGVVIYELTPLDRPHLLDHLNVRDVPEDWRKGPSPAGQGSGNSPWQQGNGGR